MLRCNVDLLRLIQLGITFADENGELPEDCPTWQFNFRCARGTGAGRAGRRPFAAPRRPRTPCARQL